MRGPHAPLSACRPLDDRAAVDQLIHGAGAREDRPLYVYQDLKVKPGAHRIAIRFTLEGRPAAQVRTGWPRRRGSRSIRP